MICLVFCRNYIFCQTVSSECIPIVNWLITIFSPHNTVSKSEVPFCVYYLITYSDLIVCFLSTQQPGFWAFCLSLKLKNKPCHQAVNCWSTLSITQRSNETVTNFINLGCLLLLKLYYWRILVCSTNIPFWDVCNRLVIIMVLFSEKICPVFSNL